MQVTIDPGGTEPVFAQIAAQVVTQIANGVLARGERLPAARDLADALAVNVHTVLHAYQTLRDEGLIELRRGRGAVVTGEAGTDRLQQAVRQAASEARSSGIGLHTLLSLVRKEYGA